MTKADESSNLYPRKEYDGADQLGGPDQVRKGLTAWVRSEGGPGEQQECSSLKALAGHSYNAQSGF